MSRKKVLPKACAHAVRACQKVSTCVCTIAAHENDEGNKNKVNNSKIHNPMDHSNKY